MEITSRKLLPTEFHGKCIMCGSTFIFNIMEDLERLSHKNTDARIKCPVCNYSGLLSTTCDVHKAK